MASQRRLEGAIRLARTYADADTATFAERELAWAVLRLAGAGTVSLLHQNGASGGSGNFHPLTPPEKT